MKVIFYGVRGSIPRSGKDFVEYGGNTSCIAIETEDFLFLFDAGTGIVNINYDEFGRKPIHLFFTHYHYDHIIGFPFFIPFFMRKKVEIRIYGPRFKKLSPKKIVDLFMNKRFIPYTIKDFKNIPQGFSEIKNQKPLSFDGNIKVIPHYFLEHPIDGVFVYEFIKDGKKIIIATDIETKKSNEKRLIDISMGSELLIMDSHFTDKDYQKLVRAGKEYGHSTFTKSQKIAKKANVKKLFFYHYNPSYTDNLLKKIEDECVVFENAEFSKEGLRIEL